MNWNYVGTVVGGVLYVVCVFNASLYAESFLITRNVLQGYAVGPLLAASVLSGTFGVYHLTGIIHEKRYHKKKYLIIKPDKSNTSYEDEKER